MKPFNPKPRPCTAPDCHQTFVPQRPMQTVCSPRCAVRKAKASRADERAQVRTRRETIKTIPVLIAEAQTAFNAFIRARDAGLGCFCCGKPMEPDKPGGSMDAGHFRSRGAAPHLRFHDDNCFGQRKNCNRPGGATYAAMRAGAIKRIGLERVEALEDNNAVHKWTAEELRGIRDTYRRKLRELNNQRRGEPC